MRQRARALVCVLLCCAILLSGCWGRRELEQVAFVTGVALDRASQPPGLRVTVQIANPGLLAQATPGQPGGNRSPVILHTTEARTLSDAIQRLDAVTSRTLDFSHTRVMLFGEELARSGVSPLLDTLVRSFQFRTTAFVMVTRGEAGPYLSLLTDLERDPAEFLRELLVVRHRFGTAPPTQVRHVVEGATLPGADPVLPYLELKRDPGVGSGQQLAPAQGTELQPPPSLEFSIERAAVFRDAQMVGTLSPEEARLLPLIRGEATALIASFPVPGRPQAQFSVLIQSADVGTRVDPHADPPTARVNIRMEGLPVGIEDEGADLLTDPEGIERMQGVIRTAVRQQALALIRRSQQEYGADILRLGVHARMAFPTVQAWEAYDWRLRYPNLVVDVEVQAWLRRRGLVIRPPEG